MKSLQQVWEENDEDLERLAYFRWLDEGGDKAPFDSESDKDNKAWATCKERLVKAIAKFKRAIAELTSQMKEKSDVHVPDPPTHKDTPRWPLCRSDQRYRIAVEAARRREWSKIARSRNGTRHNMGTSKAVDK